MSGWVRNFTVVVPISGKHTLLMSQFASDIRAVAQPCFVVGALRSGTTMFRLMLDGHPDCNIFGEFELAVSQLSDEGWPTLEMYYRHLEQDRVFNSPPLLRIDRTLGYPQLVRSFFEQRTALKLTKVVGASIHSNFHRCPELWPDAKYIHVLRDPRDVARSCIGMGWVGNVFYGADIWRRAQRNWDVLCLKTEPKQRHELKYEALVADPKQVLGEVCEFLELEFAEEMLTYGVKTTYASPDVSLIEQWRTKLSEEQIWQVEVKCRDIMLQRGYEPVSTRKSLPTIVEQLKLLVQHKGGRVRHSIDRYGLPLWTAHQFRRVAPKYVALNVRKRMNEIDKEHLK
jgi:hypothetical protein